MILPTISEQAALDKFPNGYTTVDVPSGKKYLRETPQPWNITFPCNFDLHQYICHKKVK